MTASAARIVFMGSPDFAVPSLRALAAVHAIVGVVTQPDRKAGRGRKVRQSAVRVAAQALGLPAITPQRLHEPAAMAQLREWSPDVIVVAAFGQILKQEALDLSPHGCVNVHASLLPRHRGAAPVAAAIRAGDELTGISLMKMDAGLDSGPILAQREMPIRPDHTAGTLTAELAELGAQLLSDALPDYLAGAISGQAQDAEQATYAPRLKKEDGHIDWTHTAADIERHIRAMNPWPGAFAHWNGQPLKVLSAATRAGRAPIGRVARQAADIVVGAGADLLVLQTLQPAGKRAMAAADFARGAPDFVGATLD